MGRHFGLDWLRVGAFGLLILYHIGMFFVPWDWHVKTRAPLDWVAIPMFATNSWRLALLFVVSGYASAALLAKGGGASRFVRERSARLLIPLVAAMILIVPLQPWVELMVKHGYPHGFGWFWSHDYFRFGKLDGIDLPTWNHLWFVAYLWAYTLLLAAIFRAVPRGQRAFDRVFGGWGLLTLPLAWALLVALWLGRGLEVTNGLFDDARGHMQFLPAFLFGVGLARSETALAAARRLWRPALALGLIAYAAVIWVEWRFPGNMVAPPFESDVMRAGRAVQGWAMIVALIGLADRYLNHDHPWRATLTEAVFPFYIIHQTIIVVTGWWLLRFVLPPGVEFLILLAATAGGCWLFYDIGRRLGPIRPLIGLKRVARPRASATAAADELDIDDPRRRGALRAGSDPGDG